MLRREVTDLTDQDIDTHLSKDQLKEWIRRLDPNFRVSGGIAQLRALVRRERDRELKHLRREPQPPQSQQPAANSSNQQDVGHGTVYGSVGSNVGCNVGGSAGNDGNSIAGSVSNDGNTNYSVNTHVAKSASTSPTGNSAKKSKSGNAAGTGVSDTDDDSADMMTD